MEKIMKVVTTDQKLTKCDSNWRVSSFTTIER